MAIVHIIDLIVVVAEVGLDLEVAHRVIATARKIKQDVSHHHLTAEVTTTTTTTISRKINITLDTMAIMKMKARGHQGGTLEVVVQVLNAMAIAPAMDLMSNMTGINQVPGTHQVELELAS